MPASDYFLPRPPIEPSSARDAAFEKLFHSTPAGSLIDYELSYPKWQYLSWLCVTKELVLHGSQNPSIDEVEPRQAEDKKAFSNQKAIYATTDGIWVLYFAIIDRKKYTGIALFNSCLQTRAPGGEWREPVYFFSISQFALVQEPWCEGVVYVLPRRTFEQEAHHQAQGLEIALPHWISPVAARPVAKLRVGPHDFPFLAQVHGHDDKKLVQLAMSDPNGFPWPAALVS
ncbi:MAG: hypothetical protein WCE68_15500 [Anaerolineales bacterium]